MEDARGMMCVAVEAVEDAAEAEVLDVDLVGKWRLWNSTKIQRQKRQRRYQMRMRQEISAVEMQEHVLVVVVMALAVSDSLSRCCRR
jgi:hypothetical protein